MTLTELLDRLIAGMPVARSDAQAVKDALAKDAFGSIDQAGDRLRDAADRLDGDG